MKRSRLSPFKPDYTNSTPTIKDKIYRYIKESLDDFPERSELQKERSDHKKSVNELTNSTRRGIPYRRRRLRHIYISLIREYIYIYTLTK